MVYKINDATILPERGFSFVLVAESKWCYKWISEIELSADDSHKGYRESRGYSDDGDLNKHF